jgi:hypothetical protein
VVSEFYTINDGIQKILGRDISFHHDPVYADNVLCQVYFCFAFKIFKAKKSITL